MKNSQYRFIPPYSPSRQGTPSFPRGCNPRYPPRSWRRWGCSGRPLPWRRQPPAGRTCCSRCPPSGRPRPRCHLKAWIFYGTMLILFIVFTYVLFQKAERFELNPNVPFNTQNLVGTDSFQSFVISTMHNVAGPATVLLLQILSIWLFHAFLDISSWSLVSLRW